MDDLTNEFLVETNESLQALDQDLVELEGKPNDKEIINNIFRVMHTIKGTCGFLGLSRLESVAHSAENVMDKIRSGAFSVTPAIISLILAAIDRIKELIADLEATGSEKPGDDSGLKKKLDECAETGKVPGWDPSSSQEATSSPAKQQEEAKNARKTPDLDGEIDFEPVPAPYASTASLQADIPQQNTAPSTEPSTETAASYNDGGTGDSDVHEVELSAHAKKEAIEEGLKTADSKKGAASSQSIRVSLDVLENLMQMVGELVLTRNQLIQMTRNSTNNSEFNAPLQRLNHITSELQEGIMQTRMQPIGNAWAKFPRLIRDLALELGKKIELKMIGAETDLDRQMLEAIKDPLTHMVRNAADHGIEKPADRVKNSKSETGTVTLSAYHEGGHIIIKIADDGKGLDVEKIKAKAISTNLATKAELDGMSNKQIFQFIFRPGFSTAEKITAVSGRGVGMDVVMSNIQKIGGSVELNSKMGKGSEFVITLPLTLAIMPVLIVESSGEKFAIPQIRVSEIVRAGVIGANVRAGNDSKDSKENKDSSGHRIERINGAPVLRLRGRLLPLISLAKALQIARKEETSDKKTINASNDDIEPFVVVCEVGSQNFGILVDRVFHTEEIVVKPVSPVMKGLEVYSGCTILGDGSVIMILDPNGIIKTGGVINMRETEETTAEESRKTSGDKIVAFLVFKAWANTPKAVPLELVSRLEEIDAAKIEWSGNQRVVQYRGGLMRLITIDPSIEIPKSGVHEVIVFADQDRVMGLMVEEIVDIVRQEMDIKSVLAANGMLGSMVINGITTDLIDVSYFFSNVFRDWLGTHGPTQVDPSGKREAGKKHVLLVDDSPFFRKFMKPVLVVADYQVTTAENAKEALTFLDKDSDIFDIVITDIDMPEMSGIEFLKHCRKESKYDRLPFVALTSHSEAELGGNASDIGFSGFVTKSDRDQLISVISKLLSEDLRKVA